MPRMFRSLFSLKILWRVLVSLVCLAILFALLVAEENWRGKRAFESYKSKLEAEGEHFDLDWYQPPVPDDRNFAMAPVFKPLFDYTVNPATREVTLNQPDAPVNQINWYVVSTDTMKKLNADVPVSKGGWQTGYMRDLEAWQKYYREVLPEMALSQSPGEDVLTALGKYDAVFSEIRDAAATRPLSRFPVKYDSPRLQDGHLSAVQRMTQVLALRAVAELRLGRADDALADVKLGFRLMESIRNEPLLIGGLVRITSISILMQPVWEGIASHRWKDAQLLQLEDLLRQTDLLADFDRTMQGERAWSALSYNALRADPELFYKILPVRLENWRPVFQTPALFYALTWQNQAYQHRFIQEKILPLMDLKNRRVNVQEGKALLVGKKDSNPYTMISSASIPAYIGVFQKYAVTQTYVDEATIACEIERHRLAHGSLPATLEELHMTSLPHDLIDGQPLRYRVVGADNYLLYSIGWNAIDDGGVPGRRENSKSLAYEQGDWVWSLKQQ